MKLVKCIIREDKVDETSDALKALDVSGITVTHVRGRGRRAPLKISWRGVQVDRRFDPQSMLDIVVDDYLVDDVVRVVMQNGFTGRRGDGRIFVLTIDEAYTIRTHAGGVD
jgi:nitrogen regulatory protein PII